MHTQYVISVMSRDQVGIVAEVAQAISDLKGDIADIRQSVLRGYFTMILLATFPSDVSTEMISSALQTPSRYINVQPLNDLTPPTVSLVPDNAYVLTAKQRSGRFRGLLWPFWRKHHHPGAQHGQIFALRELWRHHSRPHSQLAQLGFINPV